MADPEGVINVRQELTALEITNLQEANKKVGLCTHYIRRRRRLCTLYVVDEDSLVCERHHPDALAKQRAHSSKTIGSGDRKTLEEKQQLKRERRKLRGPRVSSSQKRMVNPMSKKHQITPTVAWSQVYTIPELPLFVDVGCAKGEMLMELAHLRTTQEINSNNDSSFFKKRNYLGLELRGFLTDASNKAHNSWRENLSSQQLEQSTASTNISSSSSANNSSNLANPDNDNKITLPRQNLYFLGTNANIAFQDPNNPNNPNNINNPSNNEHMETESLFKRIHHLHNNITNTLVVEEEKQGIQRFKPTIDFISILFPDPW